VGQRIQYELGDPDEGEPELRQRRIDDLHEVNAILARLEARMGAVPRVWDLDHDTIITACKAAAWEAVPLPGDYFGDADGEASFLLDEAAERASGLVHIRAESSERATAPGWRSWLRWKGRSPADSFRRGRLAPSLDVYRIDEEPTPLDGRWWYGIVTTPDIDFCVVEGDEVHVLAGPPALISGFVQRVSVAEHWKQMMGEATFWPEDGREQEQARIDALLGLYTTSFGGAGKRGA